MATVEINEESIRRQLEIWQRNLDRLEEQRAQYGISVPLSVINGIRQAKIEINKLTALLAENREGQNINLDIATTYDYLITWFAQQQEEIEKIRNDVVLNRTVIEVIKKRIEPSNKNRISRITILILLFSLLTTWYVKELRDILLISLTQSITMTLLVLGITFIIWYLGND